MKEIIIGISGSAGSFSEEAANHYCHKNGINNYKIKYLISIKNIMEVVKKGEVDCGIFPIENSNSGIVYEAIHTMSKYVFDIDNIFEIDTKHCLLAKPEIKKNEIKKIVSNSQTLKQCSMYLKRKWGNLELQEYSDTASAAKDLHEGKISPDTGVIACKKCSKLYELNLLEEEIQNLKFNFTTFIAVTI